MVPSDLQTSSHTPKFLHHAHCPYILKMCFFFRSIFRQTRGQENESRQKKRSGAALRQLVKTASIMDWLHIINSFWMEMAFIRLVLVLVLVCNTKQYSRFKSSIVKQCRSYIEYWIKRGNSTVTWICWNCRPLPFNGTKKNQRKLVWIASTI